MDECIFKAVNRCSATKPQLQTGSLTRIHSIIDASKLYDDDLHETLEQLSTADQNLTIRYHNSCVSSYVSENHKQRFLTRKSIEVGDENHE